MKHRVFTLLCGMVTLLLLAVPCAVAAGCAATPDAAVLHALGNDDAGPGSQQGFRVRDIVVDPLLHRAFVHVEQCGHPERPLLLLPFATAREVTSAAPVAGPSDFRESIDRPLPPAVPSGSLVTVNMGDAHMRLTVTGRLLESASLGSTVGVQLASLNGTSEMGEQRRHVRGTLVAADRVEVQP